MSGEEDRVENAMVGPGQLYKDKGLYEYDPYEAAQLRQGSKNRSYAVRRVIGEERKVTNPIGVDNDLGRMQCSSFGEAGKSDG